MYTNEDLKNLPSYIELHDCGREHCKFLFRLYINAWDQVCLCYQNECDPMLKAFSIVIDPKAKEIYTSTTNYGVSTVRTFDEAYELMFRTMVATGFIDIEEEEIRESVEEREVDIDTDIPGHLVEVNESNESLEEEAKWIRDEHFSVEDYDLI